MPIQPSRPAHLAVLQRPAQRHLGGRLAVGSCDLEQHWVLQHRVPGALQGWGKEKREEEPLAESLRAHSDLALTKR